MPDIESEIRLKSSGADQVARDLHKIKEAADDTSESLKGAQGDYASGGGSDPFSRAINQGAKQSGQTAREVMDRQDRNSRELERAKDREDDSRSRSLTRQGRDILAYGNQRAQNAVTGVAQGVDQMSQGGPGGLVGGVGGMLGKLFSGPAGWAALALGATTKVVGGQAEKAFQFHRQGYLSGTVQRLGISGDQRRGIYQKMIDTGIAPEMAGQYLSSLSQSGGTIETGENVSEGIDFVMDAGADASTVGRLSGMTQAMGIGERNVAAGRESGYRNAVANREMLEKVLPGFGQQNINTFLGGMETFLQGQQQAYVGGKTTQDAINDQAAFMTDLKEQGLTASSAAQLANQTAARDRQTSSLGDPTDMVAISMMREEGESVRDTMARMEQNPTATREKLVERLSSSGMSDMAQEMFIQERYGVNVSGARAILAGEYEGTDLENRKSGEIEERNTDRGYEATFSNQFFAGLQDAMLDVLAKAGEAMGLFDEGDLASEVSLTEGGAIGGSDKREIEFQENVRANTMNVETNSVEVVSREMGGGSTVDYLQNFGIDFSNTNPNQFSGMGTAVSVMGLGSGGLSTAPRNLVEAAEDAGASDDEMERVNAIVRERASALGGRLGRIDSEYGDDQGKQEMMAFMSAMKDSLEKMITKITDETDLTRQAIMDALGFNTITSDESPSPFNTEGNR